MAGLFFAKRQRIRRDQDGAIVSACPDGRVMPRGGYRADGVLDDVLAAAVEAVGALAHNVSGDRRSMEARLAAVVRAWKPSAEVRESVAAYCVAFPMR